MPSEASELIYARNKSTGPASNVTLRGMVSSPLTTAFNNADQDWHAKWERAVLHRRSMHVRKLVHGELLNAMSHL